MSRQLPRQCSNCPRAIFRSRCHCFSSQCRRSLPRHRGGAARPPGGGREAGAGAGAGEGSEPHLAIITPFSPPLFYMIEWSCEGKKVFFCLFVYILFSFGTFAFPRGVRGVGDGDEIRYSFLRFFWVWTTPWKSEARRVFWGSVPDLLSQSTYSLNWTLPSLSWSRSFRQFSSDLVVRLDATRCW